MNLYESYDPWEHDETSERDSLYNSLLHPLNGFPCLSLKGKFYKENTDLNISNQNPMQECFQGPGGQAPG